MKQLSNHLVSSFVHALSARRATAAVGALGVGLSFAPPAAAQDTFEDEFTVQRFDPAPGPRNYFTTRGVRTDGKMAWSGGLFLNYAYKPFVVVSCVSETNCDDPSAVPRRDIDINVVEHMFTGDLLGSFTPIERLQIGLKVPVTFVEGDGLTQDGRGNVDDPISAVGMGDIQLEGKFRAYGEVKDAYVLGPALFLTAPLGTATAEGNYIGDSTPTVGLRGIFDGTQDQFSFGANLAGVLRGSGRVGSTELGPEFRYGIAGGYKPSPVIRVLLDGIGTTKFSSKQGTNSLEIDGGAQLTPMGSPIMISGGAGVGVIEGVGVPVFRAFLGVMYIAEAQDRDGDALFDQYDECPTVPEDRDGVQDEDGCPDQDNDGDTIPDEADKCPDKVEDNDDFEDQDGCPEPDNDKDGVEDPYDRCPDKKETVNGYKDQDGCPDEPDKDNDGVADARDKCPDQPEDTDGHEDTDGCPDYDNDGDGVPDAADECVDQPETMNGFQDEDGCPDEAAAAPAEPGAAPAPAPGPAPKAAPAPAPKAAPAPAPPKK